MQKRFFFPLGIYHINFANPTLRIKFKHRQANLEFVMEKLALGKIFLRTLHPIINYINPVHNPPLYFFRYILIL
jgi:hypothetical protein